ncbi:MAG: hypothetical protein HKN31_05035, partial [Pricia sp.]|nr:hypothetical protein [Pricia sp.]
MKRVFLLFIAILLLPSIGISQDLESILEGESSDTTLTVPGTFYGTRLLNGHSVETRKKGILEFLISHRFGRVNSGFNQLFGLD